MFAYLETTRVGWVGSIFRHDEIAMRSDHIVSNRISSNLIGRGLRSNRAMRLDAMRLLKTLVITALALIDTPDLEKYIRRRCVDSICFEEAAGSVADIADGISMLHD